MIANYDWYFAALADPNKIGKSLKIHDGDPQPGFYRKRAYRDGPWQAVAIWQDDTGHMMCVVDDKTVDAAEVWTFCCRFPIPESLYRSVTAGGAWPDDPPQLGHNAHVSDDPYEQLCAELDAETELAESMLKKPVETKDQADQIAVWSKRVAALKSRADALHKAEKQPFLDGGRKVDDKWRGPRERAETLVRRLKQAIDGFLREQARLEAERRRKAEEEAAAVRRAAEEAARKAAEAADEQARVEAEAEAQRLALAAKDAEREAEPVKINAGRTGATVALRTFYAARITDYDKLLMALKDEPEIREAVEKIANRIARTAGAPVPDGMERVGETRAA